MDNCRTIRGSLASGTISGSVSAGARLSGQLSAGAEIGGTLAPIASIQGTLQAGDTLTGGLTIPSVIDAQPYQGENHITPDQESHTLKTSGKHLSQNIVVDPIPSNYGLITWNGITLTVS